MVRNPILFDEDGPDLRRVAPLLGEHTAEVLAEIGFSPEQTLRLESDGVVKMLHEPPARAHVSSTASFP
jgi:crotonobetainyl-CoA:carnitine CoA-transferase CaiB-like acyl-CoA transferase